MSKFHRPFLVAPLTDEQIQKMIDDPDKSMGSSMLDVQNNLDDYLLVQEVVRNRPTED